MGFDYSKQWTSKNPGLLVFLVDQPLFFEAKAKGSTAMGAALQQTRMFIEDFCSENPNSHAPIIINVSDGSPWSNELKFKERELAIAEARKIMCLPCANGSPLIFNAHIGSGCPQCVCPASYAELKGKREQFLFDISSEVPMAYMKVARKFDIALDEHARGFVSDASPDVFIKFINFGSSGAWNHDRMSAS